MNLNFPDIRGMQRSCDFLRVSGGDAVRFLQGMWTNDIQILARNAPAASRALLLNLKAKPIAPATILSGFELKIDSFEAVLDLETAAPQFIIAVPEGRGTAIFEALDKYLVADDVELKLFSEEESPIEIHRIFGAGLGLAGHHRIAPLVSKDVAKAFKVQIEKQNILLPIGAIDPTEHELWRLKGASPLNYAPLESSEYLSMRIQAGIPEWGVDFDEESFVLEFPFENEISFHKGCYLGQEVVARGSYRGQVAKAFARFELEEAARETGYVFASDDDIKPCGKLSTVCALKALGQLRLRDFENKKYYFREGSLDSLSKKKINIKKIDVLSLNVPG